VRDPVALAEVVGELRRAKALGAVHDGTVSLLARGRLDGISRRTADAIAKALEKTGASAELLEKFRRSLRSEQEKLAELAAAEWARERATRFFMRGEREYEVGPDGRMALRPVEQGEYLLLPPGESLATWAPRARAAGQLPELSVHAHTFGGVAMVAPVVHRRVKRFDELWAELLRGPCASILKDFERALEQSGHTLARTMIARYRLVEPLLEAPESAFTERPWQELSTSEMRAYLRAGVEREMILLSRPDDAAQMQRVIDAGGVAGLAKKSARARRT